MAASSPSPAPAPRFRAFTLLLGEQWRTADEVRDAVLLHVGDRASKLSRFWLQLVLAGIIATAGVLGDSTATVIGAMIIAPLGTPIQGVGISIAGGDARGLRTSLAILCGASVVVVLLGIGLSAVLPDLEALADNSQVTGRISPTIIDLVAASATGLAGALAIARRDIGDILPGVAIAISLVPPLAVVGVCAGAGDWRDAAGALLLFGTNVLAIVLVCAALFSLLGTFGAMRSPEFRRGRVRLVLVGAFTVVLLGLAAITQDTVRRELHRQDALRLVDRWAAERGERALSARYEGDTLVLVLQGGASTADDDEIPGLLRGTVTSGTPVDVDRVLGTRGPVGEVP